MLYSCCWAPDGKHLATSSSEGKIFIYDVDKGIVVRMIQSNKDVSTLPPLEPPLNPPRRDPLPALAPPASLHHPNLYTGADEHK